MRDRDVLYDPVEYWRKDDSDKAEAIVNEYEAMNLPTVELISLLDASQNPPMTKEWKMRESILRAMVKIRLGIPVVDYMVDVIDEVFEVLDKDIEKLTKYDRHRHKTIMGLYTEKPVY